MRPRTQQRAAERSRATQLLIVKGVSALTEAEPIGEPLRLGGALGVVGVRAVGQLGQPCDDNPVTGALPAVVNVRTSWP